MGKPCAIDLRVAGSSPAGQLLTYFRNVFPVFTKTLCRHSSLVPRSASKLSYPNWGVAHTGLRLPCTTSAETDKKSILSNLCL